MAQTQPYGTSQSARVPTLNWDVSRLLKSSTYPDSADQAAANVLRNLVPREATATSELVTTAMETRANCVNLETRLLSPQSLAQRIRSDQAAAARCGISVSAGTLAEGYRDVLRYVLVSSGEHHDLTRQIVRLVQGLQRSGWKLTEIMHSYQNDSSYKAVRMIGTTFEEVAATVELHSEESLSAAELADEALTTYYDPMQTVIDRKKAKTECQEAAAMVSAPEGIDRITAVSGVPVYAAPHQGRMR